jgi:hypothetical protein
MSYHGEKTPISKPSEASAWSVAAAPKPRLLDEVRGRLRLKHDSLRTEKAYLYWIRRYIHANGRRHPRELDGVAVKRFLTRLAVEDRVAPSTPNQALSALLFVYREVLGIRLPWIENAVRAKRPRRPPVVLLKRSGEWAGSSPQLFLKSSCRLNRWVRSTPPAY